MMKYIKILVVIILFNGCHSQQKNSHENNTHQLSQITFEVSEPINDFKIKILWIPSYNLEEIKLLGPAIIELINIYSGERYLTAFSNFHLSNDIQNIVYNTHQQVKEIQDHYYIIEPSEIGNIIKFQDVDFDDKVELILQEANDYDVSSSHSNIIFYNIEDNRLSKIQQEPFTNITNLEKTEFNKENKEIIIKEFYSCCEWESMHFKELNEGEFNNFKHYKTEYHTVDMSTNIDTIKIEEIGKEDKIKLEKIETK